MLLNRSSSLFYAPPTKPSAGKYNSKTDAPFSAHHPQRKNDKRYSCLITRCSHRLSSESPATADLDNVHSGSSCLITRCSHPLSPGFPATADLENVHSGISIVEFFRGKHIFVTGATGLLGKVFVEKILRSTPVGKVYLLIHAKDKEAALHRVEHEIINSELFRHVKEKYGKGFAREKLIPVVGDICKPNLGMDSECREAVRKDVHVIIHSAANTNFIERYDLIFDTNVNAPQRLMRFAKTCNKLQLFTHISTAYVNEKEEGIILEKPFTKEVDIADEISLLLKSSTMLSSHSDATKYFKRLGQQRGERVGWSTVYQLSKGMGEMVLDEIRGDVPLLIIRPSTIGNCYSQPLPGWVQGYRMVDPVLNGYGKGLVPAILAKPLVPLDIIPVDFVVNTMVAAIAKHGDRHREKVNVYHAASAVSNPITIFNIAEYAHEYFNSTLSENTNIPRMKFFDNFPDFSEYTRQEIFRRNGAAPANTETTRSMIRLCDAKVRHAHQICKIYEFVGFIKARFDISNTQKLMEEMSEKEQLQFELDVRSIDWRKYFMELYFPWLKKYLIDSKLPRSPL